MNETDVLRLSKIISEDLAEGGLSPAFAKLYSQHTRLGSRQAGLTGWRPDEAYSRLHDAMRLIAVAFIQKDSEIENWQNSLRRGGELLEWLSHTELNPDNLPIQLLASAAYQLAGYPARALGLMNQATLINRQSQILSSLLGANFQTLFQEIKQYWSVRFTQERQFIDLITWENHEASYRQIQEWITEETVRALGIVCSTFRWGNEPRLENALNKLDDIADVMLHGNDPYSWLLAKLCAAVTRIYTESSTRYALSELIRDVDANGSQSIERYLRQAYHHSRALAWPPQIRGFDGLATGNSFALCTPTGSGKTTVAEVAILHSLFREKRNSSPDDLVDIPNNLMVIYLVPSKALASEVEGHLSKVLSRVGYRQIVVSSLYGGIDWGPTDAWLTVNDRVVLICTYEKAEALIRFLGTMFLNRVSLVVIDEAHSVQFDSNSGSLIQAESRPLRLEVLGSRLIRNLKASGHRIIALSAVASGIENALAGWVTADSNSTAIQATYRSTRQLLGRLECLSGRRFEIRYDLLDGGSLQFEDSGANDTPFIPSPFPPHPPALRWLNGSAEIRIRPPLFWAAMHLATPSPEGNPRSVLIAVPSNIRGYAEDFLKLLDSTWENISLPKFFTEPTDPRKLSIWQQCLKSCADYFTEASREYRLLKKGIIVHHGKMPGLLARLLVQCIQERVVNLVLATSTLSEGVNLPFETVLIPSLRRHSDGRWSSLNVREFSNLTGRAGRPGFGTEGRNLILLPNFRIDDSAKTRRDVAEARNRYFELLTQVQTSDGNNKLVAISPLAELLRLIEEQWREISHSYNRDEFFHWLERVTPVGVDFKTINEPNQKVVEAVDSLDSIILASIVELEQVTGSSLSPDELEKQLIDTWQYTYARYASEHEARLMEVFVKRGCALLSVYPNENYRRRLYRTSMPPRTGNQLLILSTEMRKHLVTGVDYGDWSLEQRLEYVQETVRILGTVDRFQPKDKTRSGKVTTPWQDILRWWLAPTISRVRPTYTQVSEWHSYISQTFQYRFNWGLGGLIAIMLEEANVDLSSISTIEEWSKTELPWAAFWMKDLITWGTLDPSAAYLLGRRMEITRPDAEAAALSYYASQSLVPSNEKLNAKSIKQWADERYGKASIPPKASPPSQIEVELVRDFSKVSAQLWRVLPVEINEKILWIDPAGYLLATSPNPGNWLPSFFEDYDFDLNVERQIVISHVYL